MKNKFSNLEIAVMKALLMGEDHVLKILSSQFKNAVLKERKMTGTGFFVNFEFPSTVLKLTPSKTFRFGDVGANISGLLNGAGFLLFVKDGLIDSLEGYSYEEPWPNNTDKFEIFYISDGKPSVNRDLNRTKSLDI